MHRRYEHVNIPIEIIRTFVCVEENGSFSKAGHTLGLSQPAITAQMKRLQIIVGAAVFDRARGGVTLTERGPAPPCRSNVKSAPLASAGSSAPHPPAIRLWIEDRSARPILQLQAFNAAAIEQRPRRNLDARSGMAPRRIRTGSRGLRQ